ncbi:hypothetical protein HT594_00104 [Phenacoccus solenopsis nudivirus]|nr:hypothetical protein HT594_00104 [Phenacoccus solenopsis nudivirus]
MSSQKASKRNKTATLSSVGGIRKSKMTRPKLKSMIKLDSPLYSVDDNFVYGPKLSTITKHDKSREQKTQSQIVENDRLSSAVTRSSHTMQKLQLPQTAHQSSSSSSSLSTSTTNQALLENAKFTQMLQNQHVSNAQKIVNIENTSIDTILPSLNDFLKSLRETNDVDAFTRNLRNDLANIITGYISMVIQNSAEVSKYENMHELESKNNRMVVKAKEKMQRLYDQITAILRDVKSRQNVDEGVADVSVTELDANKRKSLSLHGLVTRSIDRLRSLNNLINTNKNEQTSKIEILNTLTRMKDDYLRNVELLATQQTEPHHASQTSDLRLRELATEYVSFAKRINNILALYDREYNLTRLNIAKLITELNALSNSNELVPQNGYLLNIQYVLSQLFNDDANFDDYENNDTSTSQLMRMTRKSKKFENLLNAVEETARKVQESAETFNVFNVYTKFVKEVEQSINDGQLVLYAATISPSEITSLTTTTIPDNAASTLASVVAYSDDNQTPLPQQSNIVITIQNEPTTTADSSTIEQTPSMSSKKRKLESSQYHTTAAKIKSFHEPEEASIDTSSTLYDLNASSSPTPPAPPPPDTENLFYELSDYLNFDDIVEDSIPSNLDSDVILDEIISNTLSSHSYSQPTTFSTDDAVAEPTFSSFHDNTIVDVNNMETNNERVTSRPDIQMVVDNDDDNVSNNTNNSNKLIESALNDAPSTNPVYVYVEDVQNPTNVNDTNVNNANVKNANVNSVNVKDANVNSVYVNDTNVIDTNIIDANVNDANVNNMNVKDTNVKDIIRLSYNNDRDEKVKNIQVGGSVDNVTDTATIIGAAAAAANSNNVGVETSTQSSAGSVSDAIVVEQSSTSLPSLSPISSPQPVSTTAATVKSGTTSQRRQQRQIARKPYTDKPIVSDISKSSTPASTRKSKRKYRNVHGRMNFMLDSPSESTTQQPTSPSQKPPSPQTSSAASIPSSSKVESTAANMQRYRTESGEEITVPPGIHLYSAGGKSVTLVPPNEPPAKNRGNKTSSQQKEEPQQPPVRHNPRPLRDRTMKDQFRNDFVKRKT